MTYGYIVKYSEGNRTVNTGPKNLDEIIEIVSSVKNGSNFLLFEWIGQLEEENSVIEPIYSVVSEHLVDGIDGSKKSILSYLNNIKSSKSGLQGRIL